MQSWPKDVDKFTKLTKIGFSMECFIAEFSRFFGTNSKMCLLGSRLATGHQIQEFHRALSISEDPKSFDNS